MEESGASKWVILITLLLVGWATIVAYKEGRGVGGDAVQAAVANQQRALILQELWVRCEDSLASFTPWLRNSAR